MAYSKIQCTQTKSSVPVVSGRRAALDIIWENSVVDYSRKGESAPGPKNRNQSGSASPIVEFEGPLLDRFIEERKKNNREKTAAKRAKVE